MPVHFFKHIRTDTDGLIAHSFLLSLRSRGTRLFAEHAAARLCTQSMITEFEFVCIHSKQPAVPCPHQTGATRTSCRSALAKHFEVYFYMKTSPRKILGARPNWLSHRVCPVVASRRFSQFLFFALSFSNPAPSRRSTCSPIELYPPVSYETSHEPPQDARRHQPCRGGCGSAARNL